MRKGLWPMRSIALFATIVVCVAGRPAIAADTQNGQALFQACVACHTEKPDAVGPSLRGVFGRKSAERDDFRYSNAMKGANLTWDEANLRAYIENPQAKIPGNRMPFGGLNAGKDVDDIVAYLKTFR